MSWDEDEARAEKYAADMEGPPKPDLKPVNTAVIDVPLLVLAMIAIVIGGIAAIMTRLKPDYAAYSTAVHWAFGSAAWIFVGARVIHKKRITAQELGMGWMLIALVVLALL